MIFNSAVYTTVEGSIAGLTYQTARGALIARARHRPSDRRTARQEVMRTGLAKLRARWRDQLSREQREGWSVYGEHQHVRSESGPRKHQTGEMMFVRSNAVRLQTGEDLPIVEDAPTEYNEPFTRVILMRGSSSAQLFYVLYDTDCVWRTESGAFLACYASRQVEASINARRTPYRLIATLLGDPITPPTGLSWYSFPETLIKGKRIFVRAVLGRADGRTAQVAEGLDTVA